jgi:hypothetical protein
LADAFSDFTGEAEHVFRSSLRVLSREVDEEIDSMDPARGWEPLAEHIRDRAGTAVDALFAAIEAGAYQAERTVLDWLRTSEGLDLAGGGTGGLEMLKDWAPKSITSPGYSEYAGTLFAGLRGGQGGILTIGMVASLAGITLTTVATAGIGLVFAGKQLFEERGRQLQQRRQQARTHARQFLDDLQFETNKRMRDLARDLQRRLRDGFLVLVAERQRTCAESLTAVQTAIQQDASTRATEAAALRERLGQLEAIETAIAEAEAAL